MKHFGDDQYESERTIIPTLMFLKFFAFFL
jgi:hypothetical protein